MKRNLLLAMVIPLGIFVATHPAVLQAQESSGVVAVPTRNGTQHDAMADLVLAQRVTLKLEQVTLREAIAAIATQSHAQLLYSASQLPAHALVSLVATDVSLGEALRQVLQGTGIVYAVTGPGRIVLKPGDGELRAGFPSVSQQGTGTIIGIVTDSGTGASIPQVTVRVDGTTLTTKSGSDGLYKITGVAAGVYRVTARRVGYIAKTHTITLTDGQTAKLNFGLNPPATQLDEVVTTVTGEATRRYEVGNVISTVNVDSIAPTAPVTSVTDLLTSRVPGLNVEETGGLVGEGGAIRIRGVSSVLLASDPIIIVDGIRVDNTPGGFTSFSNLGNSGASQVASPTRINDLDYTQIATIEVLKGPAATTEYGTDAANGVIIITTKRGTSGKPLWHVSAEQDGASIPTGGFPDMYYSWGHRANGTGQPVNCTLANGFADFISTAYSTVGRCVVDSITEFNPLNTAATSPYHAAPTEKYDLDVRGGTDAMTYYVAGGLSNAIGALSLPSVFRSEALALGFPTSSVDPNSENQRSLRFNSMMRLSPTLDLQITSTYMSTYARLPAGGDLNQPAAVESGGPSIDDSAGCWGYCEGYYSNSYAKYFNANQPLDFLSQTASQLENTLQGGVTLNWRPAAWLTMNGTVGLNHEEQQNVEIDNPVDGIISSLGTDSSQGSYGLEEGTTDIYTATFRATATAALSRRLQAQTSVGASMMDTRVQSLESETERDLSATNISLTGASNTNSTQTGERAATLGAYVDERLGWADRLYLDGSFRGDAGSGFGHSYTFQPYYGAQLSWIALNTDAVSIRPRASIGASGTQPADAWALQLYQTGTVWNGGKIVTDNILSGVGDPNLKPERSVEYEGGVDVGLWRNRLTIEVTGYSKTTQNELTTQSLGFDVDGDGSVYENVGTVRNTGVEISGTATPVQTRQLMWTVGFNTAIDNNKLVSLNPGFTQAQGCAYNGPVSQVEGDDSYECDVPGYPLYGYWDYGNTTFADRNHNGILEAAEVTTQQLPNGQYVGNTLPHLGSVQTTVGLWRSALTIGSVFDAAYGYKEENREGISLFGIYAASNLPTAPLSLQAATVSGASNELYEDGSYISWRELNVTYTLPRHWVARLRMSTMSVTGAVRNLALWTRYLTGDPEVTDERVGGADVRIQSTGAVPLSRIWFVRINLGL